MVVFIMLLRRGHNFLFGLRMLPICLVYCCSVPCCKEVRCVFTLIVIKYSYFIVRNKVFWQSSQSKIECLEHSNIHPSELKANVRLSHLSALISFCQTGKELNELLWGDCRLCYTFRFPFESISLLEQQKRRRSVYQYSNSEDNIKLLSSEELPSTFFQALIKHQVKK